MKDRKAPEHVKISEERPVKRGSGTERRRESARDGPRPDRVVFSFVLSLKWYFVASPIAKGVV